MSEEGRSTSSPKRRTKKSSGDVSTLSESSNGSSSGRLGDPKKFNTVGLSFRFIRVFSWVVLVTWGVGFTVDMSGLRKDWDMPAGSWALMTLVAGGAFVAQAIKEKNGA